MRKTATKFGTTIRAARLEMDLSQEDVADAAGVSKAFISRLEISSVPDVSMVTVVAIAGALGLDPVAMLKLTRPGDLKVWQAISGGVS